MRRPAGGGHVCRTDVRWGAGAGAPDATLTRGATHLQGKAVDDQSHDKLDDHECGGQGKANHEACRIAARCCSCLGKRGSSHAAPHGRRAWQPHCDDHVSSAHRVQLPVHRAGALAVATVVERGSHQVVRVVAMSEGGVSTRWRVNVPRRQRTLPRGG